MVATLNQIIGKVNPILYAQNGKELLKEYGSIEKIPAEKVKEKALIEHTLIYDSSSETLEPIYFFIIDLMNDLGLAPQKYMDNFSASPGSGHFSEMGGKASAMQQQATKIMADINTVLRSILNIVYDLKEFRIRLQHYEDLKSKDKDKIKSTRLALKQIWLDKVDMVQRGNSSIKAMAIGQAGFQTLLNSFLFVDDSKDVDKLDLNDLVKRILKPRIDEFKIWVGESEKELRKRFDIEVNYLRSQVNSIHLYSRWAKPYLRAAKDLEMKDFGRDPAMVKVFNTLLLELTLLGKSKLKIEDSALLGELPMQFKTMNDNKKFKRDYFGCVLVDFRFRGIPSKSGQHYLFGGRADITFKAYSLNSEELEKIEEEFGKSELDDVLGLIEGATTESLDQLKGDIDSFLEDKNEEKKEEKEKGSNPFTAIIGGYDKKEEKEKKKEKKEIVVQKETWIEKEYFRKLAANNAKDATFKVFNTYKKAHGMPNYDPLTPW